MNLTVEIKIGTVSHYYSKLSVAILELAGELKVGDQIRVKGHTSDFEQTVGSMEIEHTDVPIAKKGDVIGLKMVEHAREGDEVFKVVPE